MDIDSAKENIQPLAGGRNFSLLQFALNAESRHKEHDELIALRRDYEERIRVYEGEDPLGLWFEYISWIEQAFPRSGKESEFGEALQRCIQTFEHEDRYKQDQRMVKLYIKFIDSHTNQHEYYSFLYKQGIGTMVADMYMCWAYYFEVLGNFSRAEEIYQLGLQARAEPFDVLKQHHTQFLVMVAERRGVQDEESNLKFLAHLSEKRFALTSLHGQTKRKVVGSLRTDGAVKQRAPGVVLQENVQSSSNVGQVPVYTGAEEGNEVPVEEDEGACGGTLKSVIDSAINAHENIREPGPWSSAKKGTKKCTLFSKKELTQNNPGFEICEDSMEVSKVIPEEQEQVEGGQKRELYEEEKGDESQAIRLPPGFVRKNEPQDEFKIPLIVDEQTAAIPQYKKNLCYPANRNEEYSFEELRAYKYWKNRMNCSPNCRVIQEMGSFMEGVHLPENFVRQNEPQREFETEYYPFEGNDKLQPMCKVLSVNGCDECYEELLKKKYLKGKSRRESDERKTNSHQPAEIDQENAPIQVDPVGPSPAEIPIHVDEEIPRRSQTPPAEESGYGFNETCSTQIFNLFIKPQSISTPNRGQKNGKQSVPRCSLGLYKQQSQYQQREEIILESSLEEAGGEHRIAQQQVGIQEKERQQRSLPNTPTDTSNKQQPSPDTIQYMGKHLSVIMETTENSASSGGCQTTDATSAVYNQDRTAAIDIGKLSLTAKPRKSILKKPDFESKEAEEREISPKSAATQQEEERTAEPFAIYCDDGSPPGGSADNEKLNSTSMRNQNIPDKVVEDSFLMPPPSFASNNVSVYRESFDFFGIPPPTPHQQKGGFAVPLPPKPKAYLPLYNDSMEHFKTAPRNPMPEQKQDDEENVFMESDPTVSIYKMPDSEISRAMPDFSIFHDSVLKDKTVLGAGSSASSSGAIPKDKSLMQLSMGSKDLKGTTANSSLSPLSSLLMQRKPKCDDEFTFLESPKRGGRSKETGLSSESIMPTIAAIDPMLLENSMTFPSMKDITTTTTMNVDLKKLHSMQKDKSILPGLGQPYVVVPSGRVGEGPLEESMTFNTLMKKEISGGESSNKSIGLKSNHFKPNESIFSIQPQVDDRPDRLEESMTFNSLMRKEGEKSKAANSLLMTTGGGGEPTRTATISNISKAKLMNDSMNFSSLLKKEMDEEDAVLFAKPMGIVSMNPNQSTFPNLMMELPSSTAHGFSIFANKQSFAHHDDQSGIRMEKSISPIPSIRDEEIAVNLVEDEDEQAEGDIYKWENTLRVLSEADEPNPDLWYNDQLDVSAVDAKRKTNKLVVDGQEISRRKIGDENYLDPFDPQVINKCLDNVDFINFLDTWNTCDMREKIPPLRAGAQLEICDQTFSVRKLIGKGAFGQIYSAKTADGRLFALKQSKPCNLWEYYICIEVKCRLNEFNQDLLPAFIDIDLALVAKNASVFVIPFCKYGNLINICNEYKKSTNKNLNEKVVMVLVIQILTIIDALHACQIIHGDIKPDNFMLMVPINGENWDQPALKLIDFGQAIDMQLYPPDVEFTSSLATEGFTCSEMLDNRPWTYQTDLYCVAGTIHTLLLGKYMSVQKGVLGYAVADKLPRYLQKLIWDEVFTNLLNVPDCQTFPNLQQMKLLLKQHLSDNESATQEEIRRFNQIVKEVQVLDK